MTDACDHNERTRATEPPAPIGEAAPFEAAPPPEAAPPSVPTLKIASPPRTRAWTIEVQDDEGARCIPLGSAGLIFGSSSRADVILKDPTVSARHCELFALEGEGCQVHIHDLASRNGTFVGTARIYEAYGTVGTTMTLGHSTLILLDADDDEEEEIGAPLPGIAGGSLAMRKVAAKVRRFAHYSEPVFISGETGTGKELIARALHEQGPRSTRPFVVLNVAALPRELVESELFGHERGAFTGAFARRTGAFTEADGGTLFLDEIGELPLEAQPKLLRALDGYEVRRVGGVGSGKRLDVRVIAASHVSLAEKVDNRTFRSDLFHRLTYMVDVPPLRERRGDIPAIARRILHDVRDRIGPRTLTSGALARLAAYDYPGNVRELHNVLKRAADLSSGDGVIQGADIERALRGRSEVQKLSLTPGLAKALFAEHGNNLSAAARAAGHPRTSFRKLLHRHA